MANDFSSDSSVKALWRFESGALTVDSKGANTLTNHGGTEVTSGPLEGACSIQLASASSQYLSIADSALAAGFPLKSGSTQPFSLALIYKPNSLAGSDHVLWGKWVGGGYDLVVDIAGGSMGIAFANEWSWNSIFTFTVAHTYHITFLISPVTKICTVVIYDLTTGGVPTVASHTYGSALTFGSADFTIGAVAGGGAYIDGIIDEVVVFNRLLAFNEICAIKGQAFAGPYAPASPGNSFTGDSRFQARWKFEAGALTTDSINSNTLTLNSPNPTADPFGVMEGVDAAYFTGGYFAIADADLSANFPLKSTDAVKTISMCGWVISKLWGAGAYWNWIWSKKSSGTYSGVGSAIDASGHLRVSVTGIADYDTGIVLSIYNIYHIAWVIDGAAQTLHVRVYDKAANSTTNYDVSIGAAVPVGSAAFYLGGGGLFSAAYPLYGWLDEFVVANAVLSDGEIDAIRNQSFTATSPPADARSITTCETILPSPASCQSLTTCEVIKPPPDDVRSLTVSEAILIPAPADCRSITYCPITAGGEPDAARSVSLVPALPLPTGEGTFMIF